MQEICFIGLYLYNSRPAQKRTDNLPGQTTTAGPEGTVLHPFGGSGPFDKARDWLGAPSPSTMPGTLSLPNGLVDPAQGARVRAMAGTAGKRIFTFFAEFRG